MEIIFIRHGQGEHNLNVPERLNIIHPHLTSKGKDQVGSLRSIFGFMYNDLFVVSPTIRTIETVNILIGEMSLPRKYISPMAGPRMFPQHPEWNTLPSDDQSGLYHNSRWNDK
ncbi:phosphoglycerate mutase family protein [Paenibacillus dendritiformis]|uniref:phosphoglycerate mutase family protein n=1 Tax=Paenibacillus dendritiformis TaxID=130049 RepID=UPI001F0F6ED9|nr:phosphoglycerate mutase family protein [Paenibacillus dendritiformis]